MAAGKSGPAPAPGAAAVRAGGTVGLTNELVAWLAVRAQLAGEKITVPRGASGFGGKAVRGPLTACAEAEYIRPTALPATGGRAHGELPQGDTTAPMARDAALLRASLFTSIPAFGVAAAGMALGTVLMMVGRGLARTAR
jgi:hypothetical protein